MDIKRKAYDQLINWKKTNDGSKALLIKGADVIIGLNQEKLSK